MTARSRPMPLDSLPAPLETRKIVKFSNEFNAGTIAQIIVIVASAASIYSGIRSDSVQQRADLEQVKAVALIERAQTTQALSEIKASVKELQTSTQEIKESLAVLRGRAADGARK